MTPTTTIPITITNEATAHIRSLGFETAFDRILDHLRSFVPGLYHLRVQLQPAYHPGEGEAVLIYCGMLNRHLEDDPIHRELDEWMIRAFPPEVGAPFVILVEWEDDDAR